MMKAHATAARRSHQLVKDPCCTCHAYKAQNRQSELVFRNAKQVKLWGRIWRNYGHHELRRYLPLGSNEDGNRKVPGVLECWQDLTKVVTEHYRNVLVYTKWFHVHFYYFKTNQKKVLKKQGRGELPWWHSGWEFACQCRGHRFNPSSRKIPHPTEQLSPWATTTEPACVEPALHTREAAGVRSPHWGFFEQITKVYFKRLFTSH